MDRKSRVDAVGAAALISLILTSAFLAVKRLRPMTSWRENLRILR